MGKKQTVEEMKQALERTREGAVRAEQERQNPALLLDRAERRLEALYRELRARPGTKYGTERMTELERQWRAAPPGREKEKLRKQLIGSWDDRAAWHFLRMARAALAADDPARASVEMFHLGQELVKLEVPLVEHAGRQRKGRASGQARRQKAEPNLDKAARAFNRLWSRNDIKHHTNADIAAEAKLSKRTVDDLRRHKIIERAQHLRESAR